jgi:hypothetical protein
MTRIRAIAIIGAAFVVTVANTVAAHATRW